MGNTKVGLGDMSLVLLPMELRKAAKKEKVITQMLMACIKARSEKYTIWWDEAKTMRNRFLAVPTLELGELYHSDPYRAIALVNKVTDKVTLDNFWTETVGMWEHICLLTELPQFMGTPDFTSIDNNTGKITSAYWYRVHGGKTVIYRYSNHWNIVGKCYWGINTSVYPRLGKGLTSWTSEGHYAFASIQMDNLILNV